MTFAISTKRQELLVMADLVTDVDVLGDGVRAWMVERLNSIAEVLEDKEVVGFFEGRKDIYNM